MDATTLMRVSALYAHIGLGLPSCCLGDMTSLTLLSLPFPNSGRSAYISFLYVEHTQNNSVVHAFVDVVRAAVKERAARECTTQEDLPVSTEASERLLPEDVPQRMPTGRSGRRWHVAYTKLRNPGVRSPKVSQDLQDLTWLLGSSQPDALQEMGTLPF